MMLVLCLNAFSQQITKELIIPNKYEQKEINIIYSGLPEYIKHIDLDDSTFLLITQFTYKTTAKNFERIQPVFYKIKRTNNGFEVLWKSEQYLDTSFTGFYGDMTVENGKFKAVFLYQKSVNLKYPTRAMFYPLFLDIDSETGKIIDSVGYLGDFIADANVQNSKLCYIDIYTGVPSVKYDGKDLIIFVSQQVNDTMYQLKKNISRTGVSNSVQKFSHESLSPKMFIKDNDNMFRYTELWWGGGSSGSDHAASYYFNHELKWTETLAFTPSLETKFTSGRILPGSGLIDNTFNMFINYRDKSRNIDKVFLGTYNEIGRIKADTILTNDVQFAREFATVDDEGVYYLSGMNNSLYPLRSFQVEKYKNTQKKSLIWKKDSLTKYIMGVHPLKNDKVIALGIIQDTKNLIFSFYIAEIDFSLPNGVIEETENFKVDITPNPAGDYITITTKPCRRFEPSEGSTISIYNTLGEKVMSVETLHATSLQINISDLPKGMYIVKAGGETAKFVKM